MLPGRPIQRTEVFDVPVYAHATYSVATYGIRCEVSPQLGIENVLIDESVWISEVRPQDYQGMADIGVVAMLRNPEAASEGLLTQPEMIFSLHVRVLQTTSEGEIGLINCTTAHLSNIYDVKIQPRGTVTPTPSLVIDSVLGNDPTVGEVRIAQSVPRGLFSFIAQSQIINTAVINLTPVRMPMFHLVVMSSGSLVNTSVVTCQSNSQAFQLSPECNEVILNGSETSGTDVDMVSTQVGEFTSSFSVRVWYPVSNVVLETTQSTVNPVQGWLTPISDTNQQCRQNYQQAKLRAFVDFAYSSSSSMFRASVLPHIATQLRVSNSSVVEISTEGLITGLLPGISMVSAGPIVTPTTMVVTDQEVTVSFLDVEVFSSLSLTIPSPPYPLISDQVASVSLERNFDAVNSTVSVAVLAVTSDGSPLQVSEVDGLSFSSLNSSILEVFNESFSLVGRGSGDLLQVRWLSPCTGETIVTGTGRLDVNIPEPVSLQVELSSSRITYPGDTATFGGIPTSASLSLILHYPDGLFRDATSDVKTELIISQGSDLVSLTTMGSEVRIEPVDTTSTAVGDVTIFVSYGSSPPILTNVSLSLVKFIRVDIFANPYPPYPGSEVVQKNVFYQIETSGVYQRGALQLHALLTDGSTVSVTNSPLVFFQALSPAVVLNGNIFQASQAGTYQITGQLGPNSATLNLNVSDTPVVISSFLSLSLGTGRDSLQGVVQFSDALELDVQFSDGTIYSRFIPDATSLFPTLISLSSDTPSAASVSSSTGNVSLLSNYHSPVTVTVTKRSDNRIQLQISFACNLEPSVGDVDIGLSSGIPIPSVQDGNQFSVPLFINAGSQLLASLQLAILYSFEHVNLVAVTRLPGWPGTVGFTDAPSTGLLTLTANSEIGVSGLVQVATIEFLATSSGISSISGVILQLSDSSGVAIGDGRMRQFTAGEVSFEILGSRKRREINSAPIRTRRNIQCTSPLPCSDCPGGRELGDVNGDCIFDGVDPLFLLQYHAESLFNFELQSGMALQASLIPAQERNLDSDLNTAVDLQDAYFLLQTNSSLLNFLSGVQIRPVQESDSCTVSINATLLGRRNAIPDSQLVEVFFDIGLPFDPTFTSQQIYDRLILIYGTTQPTSNKGLALQGGIIKAVPLEAGVFGIEFQTNLTLSNIGVSVIQVVSHNGQSTVQAQTKAMFRHPDPPYTFDNPLDVTLTSFSDSTSVLAPYGYNPFISFTNNLSSSVCLTPPGPPIINQTLYIAELAENTVPGTPVVTFTARSQSDQPVTFSIASGNDENRFVIDRSTGVVSVNNPLDFEVIGFYQLGLVATDPATGFTSSAIVEISITDVNDNIPVFFLFTPNISIPANSPIGSLVTLVAASDMDEGTNAIIEFSITSDEDTFAIDSSLGIITLVQSLDFDIQNFYTILVTATDLGVPRLSSSITLNITIEPPDPTLLLFDSPVYVLSITENVANDLLIVQVQAAPVSNETSNNIAIVYSIETPGVPFSIVPQTGELRVNGSIDRETVDLYELEVTATLANTDRAIPARTVVAIDVLDENDNQPVFFEDEYSAILTEESPAGSLNVVVTAIDADLNENGTVTYTLEDTSGMFSINSVSGRLTNTQPVDYESSQNFTLSVTASDGGTPAQTSSVEVIIFIIDINDNAPSIILPETIFVFENISIGSVVVQARANDDDSLPTNGAITFGLSSMDGMDSSPFTIDIFTGEIRMATTLDFETTQHYEFIITARDDGTPRLSSMRNLTVLVVDVNDNPPVFARENYVLELSEATDVGNTVLQLEASDNDTGVNAELQFSIESEIPETNHFNITNDGAILLVSPLDFETETMYTLVVNVANLEPGTVADSANVEILITDFNEFPPVFSEDRYEAMVIEEFQGAFVTQVMAADLDATSNITYLLDNSLFTIDADGSIYTSERLDREEVSEYNLTVIASDGGKPERSSSAVIVVLISDINDNAPIISPFANLSIPENTPVGNVLLQFAATDLDSGTNGEIINFTLTSPQEEFSLTADGQLIVASMLDAILTPSYILTVMVEDNGNPPLSSSASLSIEVQPSPGPFFEQPSYTVVIEENNQPGRFLVQVVAISRNPSTMINRYFLANESELMFDNQFAVDEMSGNLTALVGLDREQQDEYIVIVAVEATFESVIFSASTAVNVTLLDQNDNAPMFEFDNQVVSIPETTNIGTVIYTLVATDRDVSSNAEILYSIFNGNELGIFDISQDGNITTGASLSAGNFNLTVEAANLPAVGGLSSLTQLVIEINPVNNFSPVFSLDQYSANVVENTMMGTQILDIDAMDRDVGTAGEITFSISAGNEESRFIIDDMSGRLFVNSELDYETTPVYNVTVTATDNGTPRRFNDVFVSIQVVDFNDNPPIFSQSIYRGELLENLPAGQSIATLVVTDADSPPNSLVTFEVVTPGLNSTFTVVSSGIVQNLIALDREVRPEYTFNIRAINEGSGVIFAEMTTVMIEVLDANDNTPQFLQSEYSRVLQAPVQVNRTIVEIHANDLDEAGNNADIRFNIEEATGTFDVDPISGVVFTVQEISAGANFTFSVVASDLGAIPLSNRTSVTVTVLPPHDLTAGRQQDLLYSTDPGIFFLDNAVETAENMYQRDYGFLVGRDVRELRSVRASLGALSTSHCISPTSRSAASVKAILVSSSIWHDEPTIQVAVQARDVAHSIHVQAQVFARVIHPVQRTSVDSSCTTELTDGTCMISVSIPDTWFSTQANVSVNYGLSFTSLQNLGNVEIQQRPSFDIGSDIYVYMEMPLQNLFINEFFDVIVYGETGSKAVGSFALSVSVGNGVILHSLDVDGSLWQAETMITVDGGIAITGVRADQSSTPPPGRVELFSIRAQVDPSSPVDRLMTNAVLSSVISLSDSDRMTLLPAPGSPPIPSSILDRNGITPSGSGAIFVADARTVGFLPFTSQADFVNTAVLDGNSISFPITVLEVHLDGSLSPGTVALCSSEDPRVITVTLDCSSLMLTSAQSQPSNRTNIFVSQGSLSALFPVEVWTPVELTLMSDDTTLNLVPEMLDPQANCSPSWQYSDVKSFADFSNSHIRVEGVDVTDMISSLFTSSDSSVLRVNGSRVYGLSAGIAQLQVQSQIPAVGLDFRITETPEQLLGIDVQVVSGLRLMGAQNIDRLASAPLTVISEQILDFEGVQAVSMATAVFSDGFRLQLDSFDVVFSSVDLNVIQISSGNIVTALGTGQGDLVQASWRTAPECGLETIATGFGHVDVTIPLPSSIVVTLSSPILALSNSTTNFIGVPATTTLQVIAVYSDGRRQDLTTDSRTSYMVPNGIVISKDTVVTLGTETSAQVGEYIIQISFSQFPELEQNVTVSIVEMSDVSLRAVPYPAYPGSSSNVNPNLRPIAETGSREQALLLIDAVLSNGNRIDISHLSELRFGISTSPFTIPSSISQNILTVSDAFSFGSITITGTLREVTSRSPLTLRLSSAPVHIVSVNIHAFPEGSTFRGIVGTTRQVIVTATLDDGRQYTFPESGLQNFVRFAASPDAALTVDSTTGIATLQGNSLSRATITVIDFASSNTLSSLQVACNLDPEVGDVDLGSLTSLAIPTQSVGSTFTVPVRVNSGTLILDSIDIDITYDPAIIRALSASRGADWSSTGSFEFTVNDPVELISVGGTLVSSSSSPVRGTALHLANVQFEAVGAGIVNISGVINTLAEQPAMDGASASNIGTVPRSFVAGSIQFEVTGSRRRREAAVLPMSSPLVRSRRQSPTSCSSPPCDTCTPFREYGDVDGNCIFDVRDASFLQRYYLTTIATGSAPAIPSDRERFIDADVNGVVDTNDVVFMLRVNFRLLRFVTNTTFTSVQDSGISCLLSFSVTLLRDGTTVADNSSTVLVIDFAHESSTFQQMFDDTVFTVGTVFPVSKGPGLYGGLVEAEYVGEGVYRVAADSAIAQVNFGLSLIQVTFDGTGATSPVRTAALFSHGVPRYESLNTSILLQSQTIRLTTQLGYSPLTLVNSSLTTEQCTLQNQPLMFENATYSINILEDTTLGTTVVQIQAHSDRPGAMITYSLNTSSPLPFTVHPTTGVITLTSMLDFESVTQFTFQAVAVEPTADGELVAVVPILISVVNVNDLPPIVSPVGDVSLLAEVSVMEEVIQINATDPDNLSSLTFSLVGSTMPGFFAIDSFTGIVTVARLLTSVANQMVLVNVSVSDGLFTVFTGLVFDIYLPSFTEQIYSTSLSEAASVGTTVLTVAVQNHRESFLFAIDSLQSVFEIGSNSGVVILREMVDFEVESEQSFQFGVSATSTSIVIRAQVSITVTNANDNDPIFSQPRYNLTIPSSTPVGTQLLQVNANDNDFGATSAITYRLLPGPSSDLFRLDAIAGQLVLVQTLLGEPSFVRLNVSATDAGVPPISSFADIDIEVTAADVFLFPIPPLVSASDSVLAFSEPLRIMDGNDSLVVFEQSIGKLASQGTGLLRASFSSVSDITSGPVGSELSDAVSVSVTLLHPSSEVYHDRRQVRVAAQVRDSSFQTSTAMSTQFSVRASRLLSNEEVSSTPCIPHAVYGTCIATVTLPEAWFTQFTTSTVLLDALLNGRVEGGGRFLTLQTVPSLPISILNEVLIELPSRDIIAGESFTVNIYGYSTYSVSGFSILLNFDSALMSPRLIIDSSQWSATAVTGVNSIAISAILVNPADESTPLADPMVSLFSLELSTSSSATTQTAPLTALVQSLSNVVEGGIVLSSTNTNSGPAFFTGREGGLYTAGNVSIIANSVMAVFPYSGQTEFLNTAVLNGASISAPVEVFAAYTSGQLLRYTGTVSCSSSDPNTLSIDTQCSNLRLLGSETTGRDVVNITFVAGDQSGILPIRIYYPQLPLVYTVTDTELNAIQYSLNTPSSCVVYQQTSVSIFTDFLAGSRILSDVLLDDILIPTLTVNDSAVASIAGSVVYGLTSGSIEVCSRISQSLGCLVITVTDEPVYVDQVVGSLLVELSVEINSTIPAGVSDTAIISTRSQFQFERERGDLLVAVLHSDGTYAPINSSEVVILPPSDSSVYAVQDGQVVALGGGEVTGTFVWQPLNGICNFNVTQTFPVSVSLPQPIALRTSLLPLPQTHSITTEGSAAALVGIPTQLVLQVELEFISGQLLDVTSDSRATYSTSLNLITIDNSGVITTSSQVSGSVRLTVMFSSSDVSLSTVLQIDVVQLAGLQLQAFPYPTYPSSETSPTTTLNLIEDTGVYQKVSLQVQLSLSDNSTTDVTSHSSTSITPGAVSGAPNPQISADNILSVFGNGVVDIRTRFGPAQTPGNLFLVSGTRIRVTEISVAPLPSNTLRGIQGVSTTQLSVDMTFSDGTQFLNYPVNSAFNSFPELPGLVSYSSSLGSPSFNVTQDGILRPLMNTIAPVMVQATAGSQRLSGTTDFVVNLDGDVGDVDLGREIGAPILQTQPGAELVIPVRVNSGGRNLGSIEVMLTYNTTVLSPISVDVGPDWNGMIASSLNDPPGEIRFGGAVSANGVVGSRLHISTLRLRVISTASSGQSFIQGTVVTFAERNIDGTTIGPPTPHPIVAGDVMFEVQGSVGKRSVSNIQSSSTLRYNPLPSQHRERRAAGDCPSPPCSCSGQCPGDTDGNCIFDTRDVTFTLIYISESLLGFSQPVGQEIMRRITNAQLEQLDPTQDGIINTNDAYFLLRAVFRLVYFLQDVQIIPVQNTASACLLTINIQLQSANNRSVGQAEVVADLAFRDSTRQSEFESSVSTDSLLSTKGPSLHGGLISARRTSEYDFTVQLEPDFVDSDIGLSIFVISFDALNTTDTSRLAQFLGPPPPTYTASLDVNLSVREASVHLAALSGYSPLQTFANTLASSMCSNFPLLTEQLNVTFVSPFQADLEWGLRNSRMGLDFTSMLWLTLYSCSVDQTGATDRNNCTAPLLISVENNTIHSLEVRPFTDYFFQIIGNISNTSEVLDRSPEAPPDGLDLPTYEYFESGVLFMWKLPGNPNGIITHYTLYIGNVVVFNGSSLSHAQQVDFTQPMNYSIEAFNSAGSTMSEFGVVIPPSQTTSTLAPGLSVAITDLIIIAAVLTVAILIALLSAMACGMVRVRQAVKEKPPSFLSLNFSSEIDGVVSCEFVNM